MALKDMIGGLFGKALEQGAAIADEFTLSKEEREQFRQKDADRMAGLELAIMENVQARYAQVRDVIVAEMAQGDSFTKRARPAIVYTGLAMYVVQTIASPFGQPIAIDENFAYIWGGVCSVWIVGRSAEKMSANGWAKKAAAAITGSRTAPEL